MPRDGNHLEGLDSDTLKAAILALERMEGADGRSARKEILQEHRSNQALQEILHCALGTDKYHIRIKEDVLSAEERISPLKSFHLFLVALRALSARKVTGGDARKKILAFLQKCHPRLRKWYMRVLDHNLRIGVSGSTVESVFGTGFWAGVAEDEFHYHGCCLAKKLEDAFPKDKEPEWPAAAEFKLDGERSLTFVFFGDEDRDSHVEIYTRGRLRKPHIESVGPLTAQFVSVAKKLSDLTDDDPVGMFLDGEFLAQDWNETSSVVDKTVNFDEDAFLSQVKVILFDWAPISAYMAKKFDMPWKKRKSLLMRAAGAERTFQKVRQIEDNVYVLGHKKISNMDDLSAFHDRSLDGGFEGTMIKSINAPHVFNRKHKYVLKLKPEDEETGTVTRVVSGEGMHSAASTTDKQRAFSIMSKWRDDDSCTDLEDNGSYFHAIGVSDPKELVAELRESIKDSVDRRVSTHKCDNTVSFRYGPRLGFFEVDWNGESIHVGGGIRFKAGQDDRMYFWESRESLIGKKIDFKVQSDKANVAKARFNKFVRLRDDL